MFKSKVPDITGKNNQFFLHSAYVSSAYSTKLSRDFVKNYTHWILILLANYEIQSRKPNILFMP